MPTLSSTVIVVESLTPVQILKEAVFPFTFILSAN